MEKIVRYITIKAVAYLLIGIMGMLIVNKTMFMHVHKMADGTLITHSHPFDKSKDSMPYKSHHHTKYEFLFFENLEILYLIVILTFALINIVKKAKPSINSSANYTPACIILHKGRAPPVW